jgi:hypothetical protein
VVPDLRDLAAVAEAEDVDPRKLSPSPRRCESAPAVRVRTGSSPASRDQVARPRVAAKSPVPSVESAAISIEEMLI